VTEAVGESCKSCGSPARGRVCHCCGTLVGRIESPEAEAEAIAELHVAITDAKDDKARARLLANGPLPDDRDVLIDAALRASQLMSPKHYADETPHAAVRRVEAVCMKLKVLAAGDPVADRGVQELEKKLSAFKDGVTEEEREGGKAVLVLLLVCLAFFGLVAYGIWSTVR
jgi:hypothetical protein